MKVTVHKQVWQIVVFVHSYYYYYYYYYLTESIKQILHIIYTHI